MKTGTEACAVRSKHLLITLAVVAIALASVPPAAALLLPGGGPTKSDCYAELDVTGAEVSQISSAGRKRNKQIECTDGDPCDVDGECNDSCTFEVALCINQTDERLTDCTAPTSLDKLKVKKLSVPAPASLSGAQCGAATNVVVPVKVKKNGKKKVGKTKGKVKAKAPKGTRPRNDKDNVQLRCAPRVGECPPPPVAGVCGNGMVEGAEACDPPCGTGSCGANELCNSACECVVAEPCACGTPEPEMIRFVSADGTGTCGEVVDAEGNQLMVNADMTPGLDCGGLYFGGRGNSVPLPNQPPNMGTSFTNVCCTGDELTLTATTADDTGSDRTCSSAGCLFGAPLPVVNLNNPATSTCVINTLSENIVGQATCSTGESSLSAPLASEIFLAGDSLFDCLFGDTTPPGNACSSDADCGPGGLCPTGIQSCPLCVRPPGDPPGSDVCRGGPNEGMACTPGTSTPGDPYPTSHDCPPDPTRSIGALPIAFGLTTETASDTAVASGSQPRVFCGFCRDTDSLCFEGDDFEACPLVNGMVGDLVAVPCESDADCSEPYESCEQNAAGAFAPGGGGAQTISLTGSRAADVSSRSEQDTTVVGFFCVPPTFDAIIDAAANLPGPGAVSLPGRTVLLPSQTTTTSSTSSTVTSTTSTSTTSTTSTTI